MASQQIVAATRDGGTTALGSSRLDELDARFAGPVLRPGDKGWSEAVRAGGGGTPALVLQPTSPRDLEAAIAFAHELDLVLGVLGGADAAARAGGTIVLDLSRISRDGAAR